MANEQLKLTIIESDTSSKLDIPLTTNGVSAGFPSPAEGYMESPLDLNRALIRNPAATFFARVEGDSMKDACINNGDLLVVDRSIEPYDGCVAVCFLDGEFTLKRLRMDGEQITLEPANKAYKPIAVKRDSQFSIWGVVRHSIIDHTKRR